MEKVTHPEEAVVLAARELEKRLLEAARDSLADDFHRQRLYEFMQQTNQIVIALQHGPRALSLAAPFTGMVGGVVMEKQEARHG